ncbi:MAG: Na(+)/H(+) antiporter subunit D, partial [Gammaproteobacteria bacterium]|nr:Na(+)/H(+) antiporter subunit D [Gammaproteobacteria bacterium]
GVILLIGALFYAAENGTLEFGYIGLEGVAGWLIFIAFGIKCAFPIAHNWLTDAYPEATVTGTVFLSAFTTKVAVYALARAYPGTELLVYIGAAMTCFPIFFAVIENDLRRVLAYSLINQVGFMVVGIGIGTALAINGAVSHAFNDVIFKGLLFMSMGAVLHMTGRINGSDLGGLYKTMPKTTILCIVGAASISAFPLFSGFVSKSMVMSAALEEGFDWIWLMLLFASAGVFHHAGIKIPYFAFFAHDSGIRASDPPNNMLLAMLIAAILCIAIGVYPSALYSLLPYDTGYNPYDATHVLAQTQLLFFSALAFVWLNLKGMYPPELRSTNLDFDWLYRRVFPTALQHTFSVIWRINDAIRQAFIVKLNQSLAYLSRRYEGPSRLLSRTYPAGSMVMWVAVILATYLLLSFIH